MKYFFKVQTCCRAKRCCFKNGKINQPKAMYIATCIFCFLAVIIFVAGDQCCLERESFGLSMIQVTIALILCGIAVFFSR